MTIKIEGKTENGNSVENPTIYTHGKNFFNKDDTRVKLNSSITGNGYDPFNGRFSSHPIKIEPNTVYTGFFGGYNTVWIDKNMKRLSYDSSGPGNVQVAKKSVADAEYVEFSGPMNQLDNIVIFKGDTDVNFTPYVGASIYLSEKYVLSDGDYIDFDNEQLVRADGTIINVDTLGELKILVDEITYIYLDASRESSPVLGNIIFSIPIE